MESSVCRKLCPSSYCEVRQVQQHETQLNVASLQRYKLTTIQSGEIC